MDFLWFGTICPPKRSHRTEGVQRRPLLSREPIPGNRPPFREIGHPSGNPVSSGRFPAGLGGRFAPESVAGFLWNHRPVSSGIRNKFAGKARFLAFATDDTEALERFLQKREFKYEIVPSSYKLAKAFGVRGYPRHFIIDREGYLIWSGRGADPKNAEIIGTMLERLLSGRL